MGKVEKLVEKIQRGESVRENTEILFNEIYADIKREVYVHYGFRKDKEDLLQDACLIVLEMVKTYDATRGAGFLTYMRNYLILKLERTRIQTDSCLKVGVHTQADIKAYNKFINDYYLTTGSNPTDNEIAYGLGFSRDKIERIKRAIDFQSSTSTNKIIDESENIELEGIIEDENSNFEEQSIEKLYQLQLKSDIWKCVNLLAENKKKIIVEYFFEGRKLSEIAKELNIPDRRIYWIVKQILIEMRRNSYTRERLLPYLENEAIYANSIRNTGANNFNRTWTSSVERVAIESTEIKKELLKRLKL